MKLEVVTVLKENKHLAELISKIKEENDEIAKKLRHYSGNKVLLAPFFTEFTVGQLLLLLPASSLVCSIAVAQYEHNFCALLLTGCNWKHQKKKAERSESRA